MGYFMIFGIAVFSIITTIGGYYMISKSGSDAVKNTGEVINTFKVVMPENKEVKYILYFLTFCAVIYIVVKAVKHCGKSNNGNKEHKTNLSQIKLSDLENPTYEE